MGFISALESAFKENSNAENAAAMAKYMMNNFIFLEIKTTERGKLFKEICKDKNQEIIYNARAIPFALFAKAQRELHYYTIENLTV